MTRLGWVSAALFVAQAAFFILSIVDYNRFASLAHDMAAYECDNRFGSNSESPDQNRRLDCLNSYWKDEDNNKTNATYAWIGLAIGSALTLSGVWKGRLDKTG